MPSRLILTALLLSAAPLEGADIFVGTRVAAEERIAVERIDHTPFDTLLNQFVDEQGRVDYRGWHGDAVARQALQAYLATLSAARIDGQSPSGARLAYWINAYNAVTIEGILREYPTSSIRNHTASLWGYNIWKNLKLRVMDGAVSLDDIEHRRLRLIGEPRIHFAIVCASRGCPRLLNEAYTPSRLDEQLDRNARHFFAQAQNFVVDRDQNLVQLSAILKWFAEDFGDSRSEVLARISEWAPESAVELLNDPGARVRYLDYDWNLNEQ